MSTLKASVPELVKGVKVMSGLAATLHIQTVVRTRLGALRFETGKCFVPPSAMPGFRSLTLQFDLRPKSHVLIVGHTDTSGDEAANLALSLERAEAIAAFLTGKADAWEAWFQDGKPAAKRWGLREIQMMLSALPEEGDRHYAGTIDGSQGSGTTGAIRRFQEAAGLEVDGKAGPITRKALIEAYMKLDGTTLPAGVTPAAHGCGESFPAGLSLAALKDPALRKQEIKDGESQEANRRVEIFFFEAPIAPAPSGDRFSRKDAVDYPRWLGQVTETLDIG